MVVNFANIDLHERPILILKNAGDLPLGVLGFAKSVSFDIKYNEISTLEFELPAYVDGVEVPYYDDVVGLRIVEVQNVGQFKLINPTETGNGIKREKQCKANSLEHEFTQKKISIPSGTYKFYNGRQGEDTVLGMILELMPAWSIGTISDSLLNKYRTFEVNNENLYNFIKGTVQESFNCIFDFDTFNRRINIRDVNEEAQHKQVFLSEENLAKELKVEENTDNVATRLDVNGAEGVSIRDVNPTGTNKLIDLGYYMTTENFSQDLIDKYFAWKELCDDNRQSYYALSIQYTLAVMKQVTESANLTGLQDDLTTLDNARGVTIQAIAQGLQTQGDLDAINANIAAKQNEITEKDQQISQISTEVNGLFDQMVAIQNACAFENYFTETELMQLDRYIIDNEISESSFVAPTTETYSDNGNGSEYIGALNITNADITVTEDAAQNTIYDIRGGSIAVGVIESSVISSVLEVRSNGDFTGTAYLGTGTYDGNGFPTGCISLSGTCTVTRATGTDVSLTVDGYLYFTLNASEYQQRSIAWDLYEYGLEAIRRLAYPSYTFSITSANFLAIEEYESFKNHVELGQKVYVAMTKGRILEPILIGAKFGYDDLTSLELEFGDSYVSGDSTFRLVDLLNKSISMGKNVDLSRYIYSSFIDSGASTSVKEYMNSALDTAKNTILSSSGQAISWDGAGLRLRKYSNQSHTAFDPEQIWATNNAIVMTDDAWTTAKMAIGKFHDANLGDCWGIVAPMVVGTIIAGEQLIIESSKRDGNTAVFRVDADGCRLYNSDIEITKTLSNGQTIQIALNPDIGIAIGNYPLYNVNQDTGVKTLIANNANFWADENGNLHLRGNLEAATGSFTGAVHATSLYINTGTTQSADYETIEQYVAEHSSSGGTQTYAQGTAPTGLTMDDAGALWYDTDDGNREYRWNGSTWVSVRDTNLDYLVDDIDGLTTVYYTSITPQDAAYGDMWYDTGTHKIKRFNGTTWTDITNEALHDALDKAQDAQDTADGKIRTFAQTTEPIGMTVTDIGDLWIDTDDNNKLYRWNGTQWVTMRDNYLESTVNTKARTFVQSTRPTSGYKNGDLWIDTSSNRNMNYIAVGAANPASDWVLCGAGYLGGASLSVDPATGSVEILSGKTMTLATNGVLALAGSGGVTVGSGTNITMASGSNILVQSGANIEVQNGGDLKVKSGGDIELESGSNMLVKTGGSFQVNTGNTDTGGNVTIDNNGITMTGGSINMEADTSFAVSSGGTVQIDASGNANSYIYFGKNVSISQNNGISADVGEFASLTSNGYKVITKKEFPYTIVISSSDPSAYAYGANTFWVQTGATSTKSYSGGTRSSRPSEYFGVAETFTVTTQDSKTLTGSAFTYVVRIPVWADSRGASGMTYTVSLTGNGSTATSSQSDWGAATIGAYGSAWVAATITSSNNLMGASSMTVTITKHGSSRGAVIVNSNSTISVDGSTSGYTSGWYDCAVHYK